MRVAPGSHLTVALRWDDGDVQTVGRLGHRDRIVYLEYDDSFLTSGLELSPIRHAATRGLVRPYDASVFGGLHGVFNDSLPDGWGRLLVDRRARELGIDPATLTPLDRLACVGDQGIGALCYAPAADVWDATDSALDLDRLATNAHRILTGDVSTVVSELGRVGGSPGGARPKALVAVNEQGDAVHGTEASASGYAHYLVKFRGDDDPEDAAQIEQAYATMARAAGVRMPETRLIGGWPKSALLPPPAVSTARVPSAFTRTRPAACYTLISAYRPWTTRISSRSLERVTRDRREGRAMFALATFNVLSHNRDDHARQFTFLMSRDGKWRLAPGLRPHLRGRSRRRTHHIGPGPGQEHRPRAPAGARQVCRFERCGRRAESLTAWRQRSPIGTSSRRAATSALPLATASPRHWHRCRWPTAGGFAGGAVSTSIRFGRRRGRQPGGFGCGGSRLVGQGVDKPPPKSSSICHSDGKPIGIAVHGFNSRWWPYRSPATNRCQPRQAWKGLEGLGREQRSQRTRRAPGCGCRATSIDSGEVSERPKEHAWKVCMGS